MTKGFYIAQIVLIIAVIAESGWLAALFFGGDLNAQLIPSIIGTVILMSFIALAVSLNAKLTTLALAIVSVAVTAAPFIGLGDAIFNGFEKETFGTVSAILYSTFILSFLAKLAIQLSALRIASVESQRLSGLYQKFKKYYIAYWIGTVATASGLIPFLHLLTVWVAVPIGLALGKSYAERTFYEEAQGLISSKLPLRSLTMVSKMYIATATFMLPALLFGVSALNF